MSYPSNPTAPVVNVAISAQVLAQMSPAQQQQLVWAQLAQAKFQAQQQLNTWVVQTANTASAINFQVGVTTPTTSSIPSSWGVMTSPSQTTPAYYPGMHGWPENMQLPLDWEGVIILPDGCKIIGRHKVAGESVITIEDDQAQVRYRATTRDFNKYLNGSDLVEEFIRYAGKLGATQRDVLDLPIKLFIGFLMIRSAEADGEDPPEGVLVALPRRPKIRCVGCGRFMLAGSIAPACNGAHLDHYLERRAHVPA